MTNLVLCIVVVSWMTGVVIWGEVSYWRNRRKANEAYKAVLRDIDEKCRRQIRDIEARFEGRKPALEVKPS